MYTNDELFYAFAQGQVTSNQLSAGNCASVALIKAAIDAFGVGGVFDVRVSSGKHTIKLKNGQTLTITEAEYQKAKGASAFVRGRSEDAQTQRVYDEILEYAYLCFAVIIKHVEVHGELFDGGSESIKDFDEAIEMVNDGHYTPLCYHFLGLEGHVRKMRRLSSTNGRNAVVSWSGGHAVYTNDQRYDKGGYPARMLPRYSGRFRIVP